jgi:hypothetical protein
MSVDVRFVVDSVALGHIFLFRVSLLPFSPVFIIPSVLRIYFHQHVALNMTDGRNPLNLQTSNAHLEVGEHWVGM